MKILIASAAALLSALPPGATPMGVEPELAVFPSRDGLDITADFYRSEPDRRTQDAPLIVLFHQAGWSRGEYREIAPKLCAMGYDCLAVDQRSGGAVNDVVNETNARATKAGKGTTFVDAEQDVVAALEFAREELKAERVMAWGSSYSAALVLRTVAKHPELADACAAFAPGEYFERFGKSGDWIESSLGTLRRPAFVTSAGNEKENWERMYKAIPKGKKRSYLPTTAGQHGSRALWERFPDNGGYWKEIEAFLHEEFPADVERARSKPTSRPSSRPTGR